MEEEEGGEGRRREEERGRLNQESELFGRDGAERAEEK